VEKLRKKNCVLADPPNSQDALETLDSFDPPNNVLSTAIHFDLGPTVSFNQLSGNSEGFFLQIQKVQMHGNSVTFRLPG